MHDATLEKESWWLPSDETQDLAHRNVRSDHGEGTICKYYVKINEILQKN